MRRLDWQGCFNVRDLGGLRTAAGQTIRYGSVVRADSLDRLTTIGWQAVVAYGVRTVIDLRNADEYVPEAHPRPSAVETIRLPLDAVEDSAFWETWGTGPQIGTPLYYAPHLERHPDRSAGVLRAIAAARPGGVVYHCGIGRDRTGMITMLLLSLLGVEAEVVAADYELSVEGVTALYAALGERDRAPLIDAYLRERGTTARTLLLSLLDQLDVAQRLALEPSVVEQLRERLLEPASDGRAQSK